jgi:Ca-activated chloride channel family protein
MSVPQNGRWPSLGGDGSVRPLLRSPLRSPLIAAILLFILMLPASPGKAQQTAAPPAPARPDTSAAPADKPAGKPAPPRKPKSQKEALAQLSEKHRIWLEDVDPIINPEERKAFLALEKDYERDAFIERFWEARDKFKTTARNEFRDRWESRVEAARAQWKTVLDARSRIFLLNGPPAAVVASTCNTLLWPLEVWYYRGSDQLGEEFFIIFYRHWGAGNFQIWSPMEGIDTLFVDNSAASLGGHSHGLGEVADGCRNGDQLAGAIGWVANQRMGYGMIQARFEARPQGPSGEWVTSFGSYSTDIPENAPPLPAKLDLEFPGHYQKRTMMQGLVSVVPADAGQAVLGDHRSYDFLLTGEVLQGGKLFDRFRFKFDFPGSEAAAATPLPLLFQRPLRPGDYLLIVKVEDLNSKKLFRSERTITVPQVDKAIPPPPPSDPETARMLAEANAAIANGETTLQIVPPHGELQAGMVRFDTMTTGDITQVTFALDGKPVLTKKKPPFSVELDLGSLPRPRTLTATAFDAAGAQLASDDMVINAAPNRFRVKLLDPRKGQHYESSLLARAEVAVPEGENVDHVDIFLNETLVATLYQPPFVQPVVLPKDKSIAYVRAQAFLTDGNSTEDLVFVNAPDNLEQVDISFVELYTSVYDRQGHPVSDLQEKDVSVSEDGVKQQIARFERVTDLPIHATVALDVSASMAPQLEQARDAALHFLQQTIRPKDRAAIVTFNDRPYLAVKFSKDMAQLAGGLAGLKAERGTSLYDTIVFCLYYFNGVKGQRAILLLSDGKDEGSRFTYDDALDYARRAGVTIYSIGLGGDVDKKKLERLSEETGGRAFFVQNAGELTPIYAKIQDELRSKYLIAYQSTNTSGSDEFRTIELKTSKPGIEVKTMRGYYP